MKQALTLILLVTSLTQNFAQSNPVTVEKKQFKLNILTPGLEYEIGLSDQSTINMGLETSFYYREFNQNSSFAIIPIFKGAYRYYYNFEKRLEKGKRTAKNSANYVALSSWAYVTDLDIGNIDSSESYRVTMGPVWGFQRTYKSKFNLSLELGLGYSFSDNEDPDLTNIAVPMVGFTLGWVIGK